MHSRSRQTIVSCPHNGAKSNADSVCITISIRKRNEKGNILHVIVRLVCSQQFNWPLYASQQKRKVNSSWAQFQAQHRFCSTRELAKNEKKKKLNYKIGRRRHTRAKCILPTVRVFFLELKLCVHWFRCGIFSSVFHSLCEHVNYNGTFVLASTINAHNKLFGQEIKKMQSLLSLANHVSKKRKTGLTTFRSFLGIRTVQFIFIWIQLTSLKFCSKLRKLNLLRIRTGTGIWLRLRHGQGMCR